jgi:hypothetical protein
MDEPIEIRGRARYLQLIEEQERRMGDRRFGSVDEALKAFAALFESEEEMDEFSATIRRWRGHDADGTTG